MKKQENFKNERNQVREISFFIMISATAPASSNSNSEYLQHIKDGTEYHSVKRIQRKSAFLDHCTG